MKRITDLERQYVLDALGNEFSTSKNNIYNSKMENAFSSKFNVKYSIGHVNGTQTMHSALAALGVREGDEVIVPPLTMSSTSLAVLQNGSIPIFADVNIDTFTIDPESIKSCITSKTKAIITVSLFGLAPDYDSILDICKQNSIYLVEDNAQCFLGKYKGKLVGEFGHFSSYSFQASKHITCGEGGMLSTNDLELANNARRFSSLGYAGIGASKGKITKDDIQNPNYDRHVSIGFNYRMSELTAAATLGQIERIDELVQQRIKVAELFDKAIEEINFAKKQVVPEGYTNSYWCYGMVLETSDPDKDWVKLRNEFIKNGGDPYYAAWKLTYNEPLFKDEIQNRKGVWQKYNERLCPNAEYLQKRMIQLKTNYWNLEKARVQADILQKTLNQFIF